MATTTYDDDDDPSLAAAGRSVVAESAKLPGRTADEQLMK
jgi:hypothetical protein